MKWRKRHPLRPNQQLLLETITRLQNIWKIISISHMDTGSISTLQKKFSRVSSWYTMKASTFGVISFLLWSSLLQSFHWHFLSITNKSVTIFHPIRKNSPAVLITTFRHWITLLWSRKWNKCGTKLKYNSNRWEETQWYLSKHSHKKWTIPWKTSKAPYNRQFMTCRNQWNRISPKTCKNFNKLNSIINTSLHLP